MLNQKVQAVSQQTSIELPKFNEVIEIKVEVNDIFNKLMSTFPEDYKHKEIVAHAIIGSTKNNGSIGYIYNALNGYSPLIDFAVGDTVFCTLDGKNYRYDTNAENDKGEQVVGATIEPMKPNWRNRKVEIGTCKIVDIDLYATDKLKVEFLQDNAYGEGKETTTRWVSSKLCTKWDNTELVKA